MANVVYLSGLMRIEEVKQVPNLGMVMEVTIFDDEKAHKKYPVFLTGKQVELVIDHNHRACEKLPTVVINGRLFNLVDRLVVLGKYIDFITTD